MPVFARVPVCLFSPCAPVCVCVHACSCAHVCWVVRTSHQFDESPGVEQKVLRLEVPVDDALAVQVLESLNHTRHAEARRQVIEVAPGKNNTAAGKLASPLCSLRTDKCIQKYITPKLPGPNERLQLT